jgi:hypothetical protein
MLETLVKGMTRKLSKAIINISFGASLLLGSGCAMYQTMDPSLIEPVKPIKVPPTPRVSVLNRQKNPHYGLMKWQTAIKYVQTPEQVQDYYDRHFKWDFDESGFSIPGLISLGGRGETFKHNHKKRKGICYDYSTVAAALLSDNNYPPLLLFMKNRSPFSHVVFLYRTEEGFMALGDTPVQKNCKTVSDVVKIINKERKTNYTHYNVINLDDNYPNRTWVDGDMDLKLKLNVVDLLPVE